MTSTSTRLVRALGVILGLGLALLAFNGVASCAASEGVPDPYLPIELETLRNGLKVIYAPSDEAKTFRLKVIVNAGFASENEQTSGLSHLLEHYLFTDARLDDNMSYLEIIKEKGGSGNGQTTNMETTYFANVPGSQASWLTKLFQQMLFKRDFDTARTEQAKKPVLLEIGQPEPLALLLDSFLAKLIMPDFLKAPDFWKSEFGIEHKRFSHAHESLNTIRLNAQELEDYYRKYYHPSNITVVIAGRFDLAAEKAQVRALFGGVADWPGETFLEGRPVLRASPYFRSQSTMGTPNISIGTKVHGLQAEDTVTLRMYFEFLAHRLMKEIRNKRGDTYTVRPSLVLDEDFGAALIGMEAPSDRFRSTLSYVKSLMDRETRVAGLSEAQFNEARELYSSHFKLADRDSGTMLRLGETLARDTRVYGRRVSEFDAFQSLSYAEFNRRLPRMFSAETAYQQLVEPPLLGRMESGFLVLSVLSVFFAFARRAFGAPFDHAAVRWVRKTALLPIYGMEALTLIGSILLASYAVRALSLILLRSTWIQSSFVYSEYLTLVVELLLTLLVCIGGSSRLVRKGIVSGGYLYLKSMTYTSTLIPLEDLAVLENVTLFHVLFSWRILWKMKWRFHFWDCRFWRAGTLMHLKSGKVYFVGFRQSTLAVQELRVLTEKPVKEYSRAA